MEEHLTEKQQRILDFIIQEIQIRGYPPSVREIGHALGIKSLRGVTDHLGALERKGYIRRGTKARSIRVLSPEEREEGETVSLPLVGRVAAGQPIFAAENIEEHVPVNKKYLKKNNKLFLLRVKGHSMDGAGIHDGDLVIVQQQSMAEDGDIVLALLEDEATLKRFRRLNNYIALLPENPKFEPIVGKHFLIQGKIVGVLPKTMAK